MRRASRASVPVVHPKKGMGWRGASDRWRAVVQRLWPIRADLGLETSRARRLELGVQIADARVPILIRMLLVLA
jgi:hypothetical protein